MFPGASLMDKYSMNILSKRKPYKAQHLLSYLKKSLWNFGHDNNKPLYRVVHLSRNSHDSHLTPFFQPHEEMVGSDVWVDYFGTSVCFWKKGVVLSLPWTPGGVICFLCGWDGERDVSNC